jgi:hypothetical protein
VILLVVFTIDKTAPFVEFITLMEYFLMMPFAIPGGNHAISTAVELKASTRVMEGESDGASSSVLVDFGKLYIIAKPILV